MKYQINDAKKELEYIIEEDNSTSTCLLRRFLSHELLKDPAYTLYAYVTVSDHRLFVKFGEVGKQTVFERYDQTGQEANNRMIAVWKSNKGDKEIHGKLKGRSKNGRGYLPVSKADAVNNTEESYKVFSNQGLGNLLNDITEYADSDLTAAEKEFRPDYPDVMELVDEIDRCPNRFVSADLCPRWGKTGQNCLQFKVASERRHERIGIVASYVATVKTSYAEEIAKYSNNENAKFVDPDSYESPEGCYEDVKAWLAADEMHYVVYYMALTGDMKCFNRRLLPLCQFPNETANLVIEEGDFGAGCKKQIEKLKKIFAAKED